MEPSSILRGVFGGGVGLPALALAAAAGVAMPASGQLRLPPGSAGLQALGLTVEVSEERFSVDGGTLEEVMAQLDLEGPFIFGAKRVHAVTEYELKAHWAPYRRGKRCEVPGAAVHADVLVLLPDWPQAAHAPPSDRMRWKHFRRGLQDHEHAHRNATVRAGVTLALSLRGASASSCPRLVHRVRGLVRQARQRLRELHARLDRVGR